MNSKLRTLIILISLSITGYAQENKVLIIGIDGCRPDALVAANTPNIDKLIENSTYSLDAWNEGTTSSGPSWSAMLTGVWQNKHGVDDNSFSGKNYDEYPHFFQYVEEYNSELNTASICQWNPINDQIAAPVADYVKNVSSEEELVLETINFLTNNNPDALFLHFDNIDGAGHGNGYGPTIPKYLEAIESVDTGVGRIVNALKQRTTYSDEKWLIIISTDHGGIGMGHGGNSMEERNIFLICSGDGIPKLEIEKDSTLSTVAPPENCLQDSVELYFDGNSKVTTELKSAFNFGTDKDFTVECRVRTTIAADVAIVSDKDWDTGSNKGFVFSFSNNAWKVNIGDGTNRKDINGSSIHDNEWHTLSTTVDRDGQLKIYEDGVAVDSVAMSGIGNIYSGFPVSFGADANNKYAYRGSIAEVRIFKKVLSKELLNNWSCKVIDSTHAEINSLVGYWRLTEGNNSDSIVDLSSTGASGIISGAKWKNGLDTSEVWTYDFSNTPRTVDVAVSAMEHLCIPLKSEWNLDGKVVGTSCIATSVKTTNLSEECSLRVYPNPAENRIVFELKNNELEKSFLLLFDALGNTITTRKFESNKFIYNCSDLSSGLYFYKIQNQGKVLKSGKFILK